MSNVSSENFTCVKQTHNQPRDWLSSVLRLHQHSIGYLGEGFTGQKTQPTVSKYWKNKCYESKKNTEIANNTKYSKKQ